MFYTENDDDNNETFRHKEAKNLVLAAEDFFAEDIIAGFGEEYSLLNFDNVTQTVNYNVMADTSSTSDHGNDSTFIKEEESEMKQEKHDSQTEFETLSTTNSFLKTKIW